MILGVIYTTGGSKGVPAKNLRLLQGRPLLTYTIDTALNCRTLDDLIVTTDNEDVADLALQQRVKVPFRLSPQLADTMTSEWTSLLHIVEKYEEQFGKEVSYVVYMDVAAPLKTAADVDGAVKLALLHPETEVIITGYTSNSNPYFNMMEVTKKGYATVVKSEEEPVVRLKDAPVVFNVSNAILVIKKTALYNYAHWSHASCRIYEIPRVKVLDINDELDNALILQRLNQQTSV